MTTLYNLVTQIYFLLIRVAALFDEKSRLWVEGRKDYFAKLERDFKANQTNNNSPLVWMHCASLGEFEQGRTLLEALKNEIPRLRVLLTFFSPSGFEIQKNCKAADYVYYLPADSKKNARRFLEITRPDLAIFVKYEFWYHFLTRLKKREIPVVLVSAIFRKGQPFFRWHGGLHREMLAGFSQIFVQNEDSLKRLKSIGCENAILAGDTRIDRVLDIAAKAKRFPIVEVFCEGHNVLIGGSIWHKGAAILADFINLENGSNWKYILAPHDVSDANISRMEARLKVKTLRYSRANKNTAKAAKVLLIDNIGMLSSIYRYGKIAYIGGGFGKGIHNILEPVAWGLPVVFGPNYHKFAEARLLLESGGAFAVEDAKAFQTVFEQLEDSANYEEAASQAKTFVLENRGATSIVFKAVRVCLNQDLQD